MCYILRMSDEFNNEEADIEEILEPQAHGGKLKRERKLPDATGTAYYGSLFVRYMKIGEYRDLIPAFKDLYYTRMIEDPKTKLTHVLREFNDEINDEGRYFHPHTVTVRGWKKKWDKDILEKKGMKLAIVDQKKHVQQVLKTRAADGAVREYVAPEYETLESGLQTFGGELMNDAMQMLRDDQELEDIYDSDELIKRKNYIVNVFGHVTKMVHGKATIMLKASQEKRENASFLMELMRKSTAGKMSVGEIQALKATYQPKETANVASPVT